MIIIVNDFGIRRQYRRKHQLQGKKVILFVGRLSPNKGIDVLIRCIPQLVKKHKNIAIVIVGSKWFSQEGVTDYIAYVRALVARLSIPVIQTGFVAPDKIQNWYAAADIFVCTSQWQEPLARVHYEAMAAGLPIITTDRGGNSEVIEPNKNGRIVRNAEKPQAFVNHLNHLLSHPKKCHRMGRYGRKLVRNHFTWNRVVEDISAVWNEVELDVRSQPVEAVNTLPVVSTTPAQDNEQRNIK